MSEDVDPTFTEVEEVSQEEAVLEESQDSEPAVGVSQEEIEELPEEEKLEHEGTIEENNSEVLEAERPQAEETVQEKYDRSLKKTRTGFGARLNAFFANFRSVDEEFLRNWKNC